MMRRSLFGKAMVFLALSCSSLWALNGTLVNNSNGPLAGAEVYLVNKNLRCTTDVAGTFTFSTLPVTKTPSTHKYFIKPVLSGNRIYFTLNTAGNVEYSIYSLKGAQVAHYKKSLLEGNHYITLPASDRIMAVATYVVRLKTNNLVTSFKYNNSTNSRSNLSFPSDQWVAESDIVTNALAKTGSATTLTVVDTLIISQTNSDVVSSRKIKIYSYDDDINSAMYTSSGKQMVIIDPSNDNDGDGLTNYEERYVYFTNAEIADSDGDGKSDYNELQDKLDPLIADIPTIAFEAIAYPVIKVKYSAAVENSDERSISTGGDYSSSSSYTSEQQVNANVSVAVMAGAEYSTADGFKVTGSLTTTVGAGFTQTWSNEQSTSMSTNWNEAQTTATTNSVTIEGGSISIEVKLINNSGQDITLVNPIVRLSCNSFQSSTLSTLIGELTLINDYSDKTVYISSATGTNFVTRIFEKEITNPEIIEELAMLSSGLVAQLTNIQFETSAGGIDTIMTNVYNRTAEVVIDYGTTLSNKIIKKRIATHTVYNDFYTSYLDRYNSKTLDDIIRYAGATPVYDSSSGIFGISSINGVNDSSVVRGGWTVGIQNSGDSAVTVYSRKLASYNPKTIILDSAAIISCVYDGDYDNDGVPSRVEAMLGSSDSLTDSDSDSITDKSEYLGWRRDTDLAGITWQTNVIKKDTDGDSLNDYVDPYPLTYYESALDSIVSYSFIALTSLQGNRWIDTTGIRDTNTTFTVSESMRGPAKIWMKFSHAIYNVNIIVSNLNSTTNDTIKLSTPDSNYCYSSTLDLPLGNNEITVSVVSKNGTSKRVVYLKGIKRYLARIDASNKELFYTSMPELGKYGIAMNYYVGYDKIIQLDPYISKVMVLRIPVYAAPVNAATKASKIVANNFGDTGDGTANLKNGDTFNGLDGNKYTYTVVNILTTTAQNTDTGLIHKNDYIYFPVSVNTSNGKQYYTAPLGLTGYYQTNNRDICIDSVRLIMAILDNYGGNSSVWFEYPWQHACQGKVQIGSQSSDSARTTGTNYQGYHITATINCQGKTMKESDNLYFGGYTWSGTLETNFRANELGTWKDIASLPSPISLYPIIAPDSSIISGWSYTTFSDYTYSRVHFKKDWQSTNDNYFAEGFEFFWKYKYNSQQTQ